MVTTSTSSTASSAFSGGGTKRILITGSSGYVGQHLLASLHSYGLGNDDDDDETTHYDITCAYGTLPTFEDDVRSFLDTNKNDKHPFIDSIHTLGGMDISDSSSVSNLRHTSDTSQPQQQSPYDVVVHLAAMSSPAACEKNPDFAWKINCPIALLQTDAPTVYLSTDQVYDGTKQCNAEDDETIPVNVYGRTKLAFERAVLGHRPLLSEKECDEGCIDAECLRRTSAAGSGGHTRSVVLRSSLILGPPTPLTNGCRKGSCPSFLQFVEGRTRSQTPTDYFVDEFRSVVHVDDVVRAVKHFVRRALAEEGSGGDCGDGVYNLGGADRVTRLDIAREVADRLGMDFAYAKGMERPKGTGGVPSPPDISMNVSKLDTELRRSGGGGECGRRERAYGVEGHCGDEFCVILRVDVERSATTSLVV